MNNTFEMAFNEIFHDMDCAPEPVKLEYATWADGYDARSNGLQCPPGASKEFLAGYGVCYEEEAKADEGYGVIR